MTETLPGTPSSKSKFMCGIWQFSIHDFSQVFHGKKVQANIEPNRFQAQTWPYGGWTLAKMSY
jgi:hypothetical protein